MISQEVGQGLPFWLPNGATIRREWNATSSTKKWLLATNTSTLHQLPLLNFTRLLVTGITTEKTCSQLWTWGWEEFVLRPMNCPHHIEVLQTPCALLP